MTHAFIYDHVRTPRGKGRPDGALHEITPGECFHPPMSVAA